MRRNWRFFSRPAHVTSHGSVNSREYTHADVFPFDSADPLRSAIDRHLVFTANLQAVTPANQGSHFGRLGRIDVARSVADRAIDERLAEQVEAQVLGIQNIGPLQFKERARPSGVATGQQIECRSEENTSE